MCVCVYVCVCVCVCVCVSVCVCLYVVHATLLWEYLGGVELTTPNTRVWVEAYFLLGKNQQYEISIGINYVCFNLFLPLNKIFEHLDSFST